MVTEEVPVIQLAGAVEARRRDAATTDSRINRFCDRLSTPLHPLQIRRRVLSVDRQYGHRRTRLSLTSHQRQHQTHRGTHSKKGFYGIYLLSVGIKACAATLQAALEQPSLKHFHKGFHVELIVVEHGAVERYVCRNRHRGFYLFLHGARARANAVWSGMHYAHFIATEADIAASCACLSGIAPLNTFFSTAA